MVKKKIAILGSTGSIGKTLINIVKQDKKNFEIVLLSADGNYRELLKQAKFFKVKNLIITNEESYIKLKKNRYTKNIQVFSNFDNFKKIFKKKVDYTMSAITGIEGLKPTIDIIKYSKKIAIANKESIICGWNLIEKKLKKHKTKFVPVDSEHFSIWYALRDVDKSLVDKIYITASGGPFLNTPINELKKAKINQATKHPNWKMGKKISIDSSTLMNKALEIIEAKYLFEIDQKKIDAIIHPEGIVHSLVALTDGTVLASMAKPDMKIPILYGLGFPETMNNKTNRIDIQKLSKLTFEKINKNKFPSIDYAYFAINHGQGMPIVLNAANEIAVQSFMDSEILFEDIFKVISKTINYAVKNNLKLKSVSLDSILNFNHEIKEIASKNLYSFLK